MARTRVVSIGGGFAGLTVARSLRRSAVVLVDRTNHHLFRTVLYRVATAALSPGAIAWPSRTVFSSQRNVRVVIDQVSSVDPSDRSVRLRESGPIRFDRLIVAP